MIRFIVMATPPIFHSIFSWFWSTAFWFWGRTIFSFSLFILSILLQSSLLSSDDVNFWKIFVILISHVGQLIATFLSFLFPIIHSAQNKCLQVNDILLLNSWLHYKLIKKFEIELNSESYNWSYCLFLFIIYI